MRPSLVLLPLGGIPLVLATHNAPIPRNTVPHQPVKRLDLQDRAVVDLFKSLGILQRAEPATGDSKDDGDLIGGLLGDTNVCLHFLLASAQVMLMATCRLLQSHRLRPQVPRQPLGASLANHH